MTDYHGPRADAPEGVLGRSEAGFARVLRVSDVAGNETVLSHMCGRAHLLEWESDTRVSCRVITRGVARLRERIYGHFARYGELPGCEVRPEYEI